jgi:hypothetical protein
LTYKHRAIDVKAIGRRLGEQHDAAIRGDPAAKERGAHLLARYCWQVEGQRGIFVFMSCSRAISAL